MNRRLCTWHRNDSIYSFGRKCDQGFGNRLKIIRRTDSDPKMTAKVKSGRKKEFLLKDLQVKSEDNSFEIIRVLIRQKEMKCLASTIRICFKKNLKRFPRPQYSPYTRRDHCPPYVIDQASIIENKERIKIYWEQLMMAAASETKSSVKTLNCNRMADCSGNRHNGHSRKETNLPDDVVVKDVTENDSPEWDFESEPLLKNETKSVKENAKDTCPLSMEGKIALELQEMKAREEELKEWRNKIANEYSKETSLPKDGLPANEKEELSSLHTTDDSNYSEYGSEEKEHSLDDNGSRVNTPYSEDYIHIRTQSLDSVSSGHSSGSGSVLNERERDCLKRKVIVRPYEDPDEEEEYPCYVWEGKETPIEREIRLAIEREEELRKEKGTATVIQNCRAFTLKNKNKADSKRDVVQNDPRGIQHRLATSRIQQEIEEANEREKELRTEGKIISTSEETTDAKVTTLTQLVENSITENKQRQQKIKKSCSYSFLLLNGDKIRRDGNGEDLLSNADQLELRQSRRNTSNPGKKGVMQQFFSTKGQPFLSKLNVQCQLSDEEFQSKPIAKQSLNSSGEVVVHTRKGYTPVAEKIQEELMDNKKREEELRSQRARALARSQPDLLSMFENEGQSAWTSREPASAPSKLTHSLSNPNLLDDIFDKVHKRPSSKRFSLLEEWEKRIRENNRNE